MNRVYSNTIPKMFGRFFSFKVRFRLEIRHWVKNLTLGRTRPPQNGSKFLRQAEFRNPEWIWVRFYPDLTWFGTAHLLIYLFIWFNLLILVFTVSSWMLISVISESSMRSSDAISSRIQSNEYILFKTDLFRSLDCIFDDQFCIGILHFMNTSRSKPSFSG